MPRLSRWIIRSAFIYLIFGFTIGGLLLTNKGVPLHPILWSWLPIHIEFLLIGWIVQLTIGVAYWILLRYWTKPRRPNPQYALIAYILLNIGIWLVVAGTTLRAGPWVAVAGRVAETIAVGFFALHAWKRIVSREGV